MSRVEAAVKAWDHYWGDRYGDEALEEMGEEVAVALAAADAHDAANGIHRVKLDDAAVERAAIKLCGSIAPCDTHRESGRAIIAALREASDA